MKYYLLMYADEKAGAALPKAEMDAWIGDIKAWGESMEKAGVLIGGGHLHPTSAASTVRIQKGEKIVTHGPFAETKEQLGGFCILECGNLDEALEWAAKAPQATFGSVEIRPAWDLDLMASVEAARALGMLKS